MPVVKASSSATYVNQLQWIPAGGRWPDDVMSSFCFVDLFYIAIPTCEDDANEKNANRHCS